MAKLNVVIPAVDVEIDGVKYRKVDRSVREGDVIKITDNDDSDSVIEGGFYEVDNVDSWDDPQIIDEDGDEFDCCGMDFEVYEKVAQQYREVKRWAEEGERIRIVNSYSGEEYYEQGAEFIVNDTDGDGDVRVTAAGRDNKLVKLSEYIVLEPIEAETPAQPKRLTVGDYAKVVRDSAGTAKIGAIVKITTDDRTSVPYIAEYADGNPVGVWLRESEVVPATEAEFLAQNRLKVGEFAKVTNPRSIRFHRFGHIVEITEDDHNYQPFKGRSVSDGDSNWYYEDEIVRATEAEVAAAKQAVKYGDFNDGDYAQIVNATEGNASWTVVNNKGKFGKVTRELGITKVRGLMLTFADGDFGYANADALRKVTKEEYEAAIDPRSKFAKGDKVRLISGGDGLALFGFKNGNIYTVSDPKTLYHSGERVEIADKDGLEGYAKPEQLEKVNAEEEKWAAIGRKVNEYKRGDIVEITKYQRGAALGTRVEIKNADTNIVTYDGGYVANLYAIKLVVPVEQRFDIGEKAAA